MATSAGVTDDLAELKCFVLESMRKTLVDNVDPTKFLPFLRSKFVLSGRESDTIKSCCSRSVYDGADKLIDVLCTKGARGYDVFCEAILHDKTQVFLLTALNQRLEKVKHLKKEQELAHAEQIRQRIMLEQSQLRELSEVRPYQVHPGKGRGTGGGNYGIPRAHYMTSRSPGICEQQYYPSQHAGNTAPNPDDVLPPGTLMQQPANTFYGNVAPQCSDPPQPGNQYMGYSDPSETDNPCGQPSAL